MKRKNLSPMRAIFALLIGVCLAGFTAVQAEEGEDGESDVERTLFDLRVSYYDSGANANARRTAIEANFRYFAEALYEATNGAHQLRNVTIYVDGAFKDNADVVWVEKCHPNAHINGRSRTGYRIEHCDHFGDSQNYLESTMWGGYTLMHEWGHFAYGLFDEYRNDDTACDSNDPGGPCRDDTPVPNSVMHNQDNAGTENNQLQDATWLNFSTARNNTKKTAQHRVYSLSGWETLVRNSQQDSDDVVYYSNNLRRSYYANLSQVAPTQESDPVLIITDPQNRQDATSALSFSWKTAAVGTRSERRARAEHTAAVEALDTTRVTKQMAEDEMLSVAKLLVIENSERLSAAMLESVKDAAGQLIDDAVIGDTIAILSFGATVQEVAAPRKIASDADLDQLLDALQGIQPGSGSGALGEALQTGANLLKSANLSASVVGGLFLFTSGTASDVDPLSREILTYYQESDTAIFSFGLSRDVIANQRLQQLAEATRGSYYHSVQSNVLFRAVQQADQQLAPMVEIMLAQGFVSLSNNQEVPFYVDRLTGTIDLLVSYPGSPQTATFTVIDPQGGTTLLNQSKCVTEDSDPEDLFSFCTVEVKNTPDGEWKLSLSSNSSKALEIFYAVYGEPKDNSDAIYTVIHALDPIIPINQPVILTAQVAQDFPITDLKVTGLLEYPDGSTTSLAWRDDGERPDTRARDGSYTATFTPTVEGSYFAFVQFDNLDNQGKRTNRGVAYAQTGVQVPADFFELVDVRFIRADEESIVVTAPPQLALTSVTPGDRQLTLAFNYSGGGSSEETISFTATCTPAGGGASVIVPGTDSPIIVTGLTNGVSYNCGVSWANGGPTVQADAAATPLSTGASGAHPIPTLGHLPLLLLSGLLGLLAIRRYAVFMKR